MIEIELIPTSQITDADIGWLIAGCKRAFDGVSPQEQAAAILQGAAGFYRLSGDVEGCVVLSPSGHGLGMEITALAGSGLIRHFEEVHEKICAAVLAAGYTRVSGFVTSEYLTRLYLTRTKAKKVATVVVEDLK